MALAEIERHRGLQFDGRIVDALIRRVVPTLEPRRSALTSQL